MNYIKNNVDAVQYYLLQLQVQYEYLVWVLSFLAVPEHFRIQNGIN